MIIFSLSAKSFSLTRLPEMHLKMCLFSSSSSSSSDGCGRTGTYLCIDANLEFADEDNMFEVFGYTRKMRDARKGMIESVVRVFLVEKEKHKQLLL